MSTDRNATEADASSSASVGAVDPAEVIAERAQVVEYEQVSYPLADEPVLDNGVWWSPKGTPLTTVYKVDVDLLAQAYAAETDFDIPEPELDSVTRNAWRLGYRNPRIASAVAAAAEEKP